MTFNAWKLACAEVSAGAWLRLTKSSQGQLYSTLILFQLRKCTLIVDEENKQILYPTQTNTGEKKEGLLMNCTICIQGHTEDGSFVFIFDGSMNRK